MKLPGIIGLDVVLPRDSQPLTDAEYAKLRSVCAQLRRIVELRESYIKDHGLDVAIHNPGANWSLDQPLFAGYRALIGGERPHLDRLRVFSQMFSGHYLGVADAAGWEVPAALPKDLDAEALAFLRQAFSAEVAPWWMTRYQSLISRFPALAALSPPRAFGETGVLCKGVIVNYDTHAYLERLSILVEERIIESLQRKRRPVIMEIGSGYGALAYYIRQLVPDCVYICVDIPESLLFSALYLSRFQHDTFVLGTDIDPACVADHDAAFVPNYMFDDLAGSGVQVDLAINTLSMSEMTAEQVTNYCRGIRSMLTGDGVFFEQNQDNRHLGMLFARDIIGQHFDPELSVRVEADLTQGTATVWRNGR
jgi:hypothetical protein